MAKRDEKSRRISKGMPSAVLLSIAIHATLFFLAGALVVFTVVKKKEVEFEPPKAVERPKMKLKKPKPRIKKSSRPKKANHIVAKVNPVNMPEIQLPELGGMGGDGLGEGILGGFDTLPDLSEPTLFGSSQSIGNDFVGTFYDFKRDRTGKSIPVDISHTKWRDTIHKFLRGGWKPSEFARYYRAPRKLYATNLVVPLTRASIAPLAFDNEDAAGAQWAVHYKGQLVCPVSHPDGITFRFWGSADTILVVRVDGEIVLASVFGAKSPVYYNLFWAQLVGKLWDSDSADSLKYVMGNDWVQVGDWITLEPGESLDMEILIGDSSHYSAYFLVVEEEGVEYERNRAGAPILPVFKTTELSHDMLDLVYKHLPIGEMISLTNGPVFCDYNTSARAAVSKEEEPEPSVPEDSGKEEIRTWTLADGRTTKAKFINFFGGKVVLQDARGRVRKIPPERLSVADVEYAELANPPDFDINFLKNFHQKRFSGGCYDILGWGRTPEDHGRYGVQLKQTSPGDYDYGLQVEMFVVGRQIGRSKYILLDHQKTTFVPSEQEARRFEYRSKRKVVIGRDEYFTDVHGEKYYGYLVEVVDARGKVVAMESSHKWLPRKLDNLKKLSVGNYMDDDCLRTYPDQPKKCPSY